MKKGKHDVCYFTHPKGWPKLITHLVDNGLGSNIIVLRASGLWKAAPASESRFVNYLWST